MYIGLYYESPEGSFDILNPRFNIRINQSEYSINSGEQYITNQKLYRLTSVQITEIWRNGATSITVLGGSKAGIEYTYVVIMILSLKELGKRTVCVVYQ